MKSAPEHEPGSRKYNTIRCFRESVRVDRATLWQLAFLAVQKPSAKKQRNAMQCNAVQSNILNLIYSSRQRLPPTEEEKYRQVLARPISMARMNQPSSSPVFLVSYWLIDQTDLQFPGGSGKHVFMEAGPFVRNRMILVSWIFPPTWR